MSYFVLAVLLSITAIFWARAREAEGHQAKTLTQMPSDREVKCGIANPHVLKISRRIVGGTEASRAEFPWQVLLTSQVMCGGIVIHKRWVLTAAHCFKDNKNPSAWRGLLGEHDRHTNEGPEVPVVFDALIIHKDYNKMTKENDIALLRIHERTVTPFTRYIRPVCLPNERENFRDNCTVTGWGVDSFEGEITRHLHKAVVPIVSREKCTALLRRFIPDSMLCAGHEKGGIDSCQGDSGGPLVCNKNGVWIVAGIVSWGYKCAQPNKPGVYTNVAYFRDWINGVESQNFAKGFHQF